MKPFSLHLLLFAMMGWLLTACELETSDNGQLDGYWQLARVDTLRTGGQTDWTQQLQFWSVQCNLLQVTDRNYQLPALLFRFDHEAEILRLYEPYLLGSPSADIPLTDYSVLQPYAIEHPDMEYHIEFIDTDEMQLRSDSLRLHFNRY